MLNKIINDAIKTSAGIKKGFTILLKTSSLAPGFDEILVPGELEEKQRQQSVLGIDIDEKTWEQIVDFGYKYGIVPPQE